MGLRKHVPPPRWIRHLDKDTINMLRIPPKLSTDQLDSTKSTNSNSIANDIKKDPETFLNNHIVSYRQPAGNFSDPVQLRGRAFSDASLGETFLTHKPEESDGKDRGAMTYLFIPMRAAGSDARLSITTAHNLEDNDLCVTGQQTALCYRPANRLLIWRFLMAIG
jgi:hypothetical protein